MKIWYPVNFKKSGFKDIQMYILRCQVDLGNFKMYLKSNFNNIRWKSLRSELNESSGIFFMKEINIVDIANRYVNSLQCKFDPVSSRCYYFISDFVQCPGTTQKLDFVIKSIEFGNDKIPPMNWIRHSYLKFSDFVVKGLEK